MEKKKKNISNSSKIFPIQIRAPYFFGAVLFVLAAVLLVTEKIFHQDAPDAVESTSEQHSKYLIRRATGNKFTRPLLSAKPANESGKYGEIKKAVNDFITTKQYDGVLLNASVYFRDFDNADWTALNPDEKYTAGSLLKIPLMMTVLENEEANSGFLNRNIPFNQNMFYPKGAIQFIVPEHQIEYGKSYTYEELVQYMIVYSDNLAYTLLRSHIPKEVRNKLYEELNLPQPNFDSLATLLTVTECSAFMESLVNSSILNRKNSEFALDMLAQTTFSDGIVKGMADSAILTAHKFAEAGTLVHKELHETAVVYVNKKPYLLTIMTRGKGAAEYADLAKVIEGIAKIVHDGVIKIQAGQDATLKAALLSDR